MAKKSIAPAIRALVLASHDCCVVCGTWDADECGHIVSEANGGEAVQSNLVRMCGRCNRVQGKANVAFRGFATYTLEPALVTTRRAYWAKYCKAAAAGIAKPYKPA